MMRVNPFSSAPPAVVLESGHIDLEAASGIAREANTPKFAKAQEKGDNAVANTHASDYSKFVELADKTVGLGAAEVAAGRVKFGWNELEEKKRSPLLLFLSFFWGPMPIMIWAAIIIELAQAILTGEAWIDFAVLLTLQFANAIVGFIEEFNSGNAIDAL